MKHLLAFLLLPATFWAADAYADEPIRSANNVEALTLAVSHMSHDQQSRDSAGDTINNRLTGPQIEFGYASTRIRDAFGVPGFYSRVEFALGYGRENFAGASLDPSTGAVAPDKGPLDVLTETARGRFGYEWELGSQKRVALTPFIGVTQQAWRRNSTAASGTAVYFHDVLEAGLMVQASLSPRLVLGADASVGHVVGSWQIDHGDLIEPRGRIATTGSLYLDHRSDATSHERLLVRQSSLRFGEPAQSTGVLEPRRNSGFTIGLEFGTTGNLFEELFH